MIVESSSTTINNTGFESKKFLMEASGAAFKIISSSLYERKEEAVLRELSANAYDAHKDSDKEYTPIEITLPTEINPFLVVTDVGIGMSLETIENILTTYFASTKASDNKKIGGFGLGFKSPFAISESYTVKTINEGILTELIISLDNGEPEYTVVVHKPTTESDGTTVTVPVDRESTRYALSHAATFLFDYWKVSPIIDGNPYTPQKTKPFFDTKHYTVEHNSWNPGLYSVFGKALIGEFSYEIPHLVLRYLDDKLEKNNKSKKSYFLKHLATNYRVILSTEVGDLEIAPSRERIEDTDKNRLTIYNLVNSCIETATDNILNYTEEAIDKIYEYTKDLKVGTLGLSMLQRIKVYDSVTEIIGTRSLVHSVLEDDFIENLKFSPETEVKFAHIVSLYKKAEDFYPSYHAYGNRRGNLSNFIDPNSYSDVMQTIFSSGSIKAIDVFSDMVKRRSPRYLVQKLHEKDKSFNLYVLDEDKLTTVKKSRINKTFVNSDDSSITYKAGSVEHTLNEENYIEFTLDANNEKLKEIIDFYLDNITVVYVKYSELEPYLEATNKRSSNGTKASRKNQKENYTVLDSSARFYIDGKASSKSVTVGELYKDELYKDYKIIVQTQNVGTSTTRNLLSLTTFDKPILLLKVESKELNNKRYKNFKEKFDILEFNYYRPDATEILKYLVEKEFDAIKTIVKVSSCTSVKDPKYYPKKYAKIVDKYGQKFLDYFCASGFDYNPISIDSLKLNNKQKEIFSLLAYTKNSPQILNYLPTAVVRQVVFTHFNLYEPKE